MSRFDQHDERAGLCHCNIVTPPQWRELALRAIREFKSTGQTVAYEEEFRRGDGSRWWGLFTAKQLDAGESVGYVIDITKRQRAEQNLRESEARFRALAEASPALIWQVDARGMRFTSTSPTSTWSECPPANSCRTAGNPGSIPRMRPAISRRWSRRCGSGAACSTACG